MFYLIRISNILLIANTIDRRRSIQQGVIFLEYHAARDEIAGDIYCNTENNNFQYVDTCVIESVLN